MTRTHKAKNSDEKLLDAGTLQERVALRAYELYELRNREGGFELRDWLQAEHEVLGQLEPSDKPAK